MNHIVRFDGYGRQNEVFRGLGTALGRVAGTITNALSGRLQPRNTSDNDLAREILAYVQNMPRNYNNSGQFNNRTPNKTQHTSYMFVGNPFDTMFMNEETVEADNIPQNIRQSIPQNAFVDNGRKVNFKKVDGKKKLELKKLIWSYSEPTNNDWRIDVLQHGDYKTTNEPEYSVYISKVKGTEVRPFEDERNRGKNTDEPKESNPKPNPKGSIIKPEDQKNPSKEETTQKKPLQLGSGPAIKKPLQLGSGPTDKNESYSNILSFNLFEQITGTGRQRNFGGRGSGGVNLGSLDAPTKLDLGPTFDKNQQLACTLGLSREIWQECYTINQAVTKTPTGDARGGFASRHLFRNRY